MKKWSPLPVLFLLSGSASAVIVDGTRDAAYGVPIVVQAVQAQFGGANPPGSLAGSELDAAYAVVGGGNLYLMLTGNLEPNFNKLEVFFDTKVGGENTLSATPGYDFNQFAGLQYFEVVIPEPTTASLLLLGCLGLGMVRARRAQKVSSC